MNRVPGGDKSTEQDAAGAGVAAGGSGGGSVGVGVGAGAGAGIEQSAEQRRYALCLDWGTRLGLGVLVASFAAYALGWLPARATPEQLAQWWGLPLGSYLERSGAATGWSWAGALGQGDAIALLGVALLAGCSVPCLLALLPLAWKRGDRRLVWLCLAEVAVIVLAASGLVTGGH